MALQFNQVMLEQTLAAVPLFVFMGIMMEQAGLMERLFRAVQLMLASTRGSLYIAVLFVSTIFAAATGIVGASVTILGIMAAKTMNRSGYDVKLAAGTITAGGTLGILIPPSIMLVVMGPVLEVPVTDLFAAAIVPGVMLAFLYTAYALVRCWLNPKLGPPLPEDEHPNDWGVVFREFFLGLVPPAALVAFALGSILFGWATPTEGAGCGAFGALLLTARLRPDDPRALLRGADQDPRDQRSDPLPGRRLQLLRRRLLPPRHADHADRAPAAMGPLPDAGAA